MNDTRNALCDAFEQCSSTYTSYAERQRRLSFAEEEGESSGYVPNGTSHSTPASSDNCDCGCQHLSLEQCCCIGACGPAKTFTTAEIIWDKIEKTGISFVDILSREAPLWKRVYADDATWILTSSFLIFTMQTGFALLEMGSSRAGNEVNILLKNVADVLFGSLAYYLLGFGISFGEPSIPFMGLGDFAPGRGGGVVESGLFYSLYIFQLSFAATSTTIVSGCIAMRLKFLVYCAFSFFAVVFYGFVVHWIWAEGGWLAEMGVMDFAGGGPVHLFGGINGLVGILFVGARTGRYDGSRPRSDFLPVSPTSTLFGLLILWWAWLGFNCGSSFGITGYRWVVATRCALTTINASAAGGIVAMIKSLRATKGRYIQPWDVSSGILGSLVAITPACASVRTYDAYIIGAFGAVVGLYCIDLLNHFEVDDPVGAVGVHAGSAIWGLIAVGLFADGNLVGVSVDDGLFRGGGLRLLGVQCLEIVVIIGWSLLFSGAFFYLAGVLLSNDLRNPRKGLRVSIEEEKKGADVCLHGLDRSSQYGDEDESTTVNGFRDSSEEVAVPRRNQYSSRRPRQTQLMFRSFRRESVRLPRFSRHGSRLSRSFRRKSAREDMPNQVEAEETTGPVSNQSEVIGSLDT